MERCDRTSVATFFADEPLSAGSRIELEEAAAQHMRVRRLQVGDAVRLTNGRGSLGEGSLEQLSKRSAVVSLDHVTDVPRLPHLRLFVPVADRDRMFWLAEKSAELVVSAWQPVLFRRSVSVSPRGQGAGFMRRARARMIAAIEQSGGAWLPELCPELPLEDALVRAHHLPAERFLLERGAEALAPKRPRAADVMIGPEGGIDSDERMLIVETHGWLPVSLGETTLRFETAGVVAAGLLRAVLSQP